MNGRRQRAVRAARPWLLLAGARCWWLARLPPFTIRVHHARRRRRAQQPLDHPRQRRAASWPATSCRSTSTRAREAFESVPWVRHAMVRRVWPESPGGAARGASRRPRCGTATSRRASGWSTASARCSRPTSATSRTRPCRRFEGPDGSSARVLAMHARSSRLFAAARQRGSMRCSYRAAARGARARQRRGGRARPRQRRGRGGARAARFVRTLRQVTARYPAAAASTPTCAIPTAMRCA